MALPRGSSRRRWMRRRVMHSLAAGIGCVESGARIVRLRAALHRSGSAGHAGHLVGVEADRDEDGKRDDGPKPTRHYPDCALGPTDASNRFAALFRPRSAPVGKTASGMMTPALRKFALTAHVTSSVGWLGSVAAFLGIAVVGLVSPDAQTMRAVYVSMELIGWFVSSLSAPRRC